MPQISQGSHFTIALKSDGTLWSWGANNYGQLGNGEASYSYTLNPIMIGGGYVSVDAGDGHVLALQTDGRIRVWGNNSSGQFGDGTRTSGGIGPTKSSLVNGSDYISISAGDNYNAAIKKDGTLWMWGSNNWGQLGDGTYTAKYVPTQIGTDFISVSASTYHTIGLKKDGTLWAWGLNKSIAMGFSDLLGTGTNIENSPTPIKIGSGYVSAKTYYTRSLAVKNDDSIWGWGDNSTGALGNGTLVNLSSPTKLDGAYLSITSGGGGNSLGIKHDGTLWAWGDNTYGQLGDGSRIRRLSAVQIGSGYTFISTEASTTIAIQADGTLWSWGNNQDGQLGNGTREPSLVPSQVKNKDGKPFEIGILNETNTGSTAIVSPQFSTATAIYSQGKLSLLIPFAPASTDKGNLVDIYIIASLAGKYFTLSPSGWMPLTEQWQPPSYQTIIPGTSFEVKANFLVSDITPLDKAEIYVGYGKNSLDSFSNMLTAGSYAKVYQFATTEYSAQRAFLADTDFGKALNGKLTYPQTYNSDRLYKSEFQRVRLYVWERLLRPKISTEIALDFSKITDVDRQHQIAEDILNGANALLDVANLSVSIKELTARGLAGSPRKLLFTAISPLDAVNSNCSIEAYLISETSNGVELNREKLPVVDSSGFCTAASLIQGGVSGDDAASNATTDAFSQIYKQMLRSGAMNWRLVNSLTNGVKLSPIDRLQYLVKSLQIINDAGNAWRLSIKSKLAMSKLIAKMYLDAFSRAAGDSTFMTRLISNQTETAQLLKTRDEQISALAKYYTQPGVLCDWKDFALSPVNEYVPLINIPQGSGTLCDPNIDFDEVNRQLNFYLPAISNLIQRYQDKVGPLN